MSILLTIALLAMGLLMWFMIYGFDCALNGAFLGCSNQPKQIIRCMIEDIMFNIPGGWERRLARANGSHYLAKMYPGPVYTFLMHIALPLTPLGLYYLFFIL